MRKLATRIVPPPNDYVLTSSGISWNVDQAQGDGIVSRISAGEKSRLAAMQSLLGLARRDGTDAWEVAGAGTYQLLARNRPVAV